MKELKRREEALKGITGSGLAISRGNCPRKKERGGIKAVQFGDLYNANSKYCLVCIDKEPCHVEHAFNTCPARTRGLVVVQVAT